MAALRESMLLSLQKFDQNTRFAYTYFSFQIDTVLILQNHEKVFQKHMLP